MYIKNQTVTRSYITQNSQSLRPRELLPRNGGFSGYEKMYIPQKKIFSIHLKYTQRSSTYN